MIIRETSKIYHDKTDQIALVFFSVACIPPLQFFHPPEEFATSCLHKKIQIIDRISQGTITIRDQTK